MSNKFELLPKDMIREIVKHLDIDSAQDAALAYPSLNDAVQFVWQERFHHHFPAAAATMTQEEKANITDWAIHFFNVRNRVYRSIPVKHWHLFYELNEGRHQAVLEADLTLSDLHDDDQSTQYKTLLTLAVEQNKPFLLNHFYALAKKYYSSPQHPGNLLVNKIDRYGFTILHWAVITNQHSDTIKHLVTLGCDINRTTTSLDTPLTLAVTYKRRALIKPLLYLGAKNSTASQPQSALHLAASHRLPAIMHELLTGGPSTNRCAITPDEQAPLSLAAKHGYRDVIQVILEDTKNPDLIDNVKGRTALHIAARNGQLEIVNYLLSERASVDAVDISGITPLHLSIKHGHDEVTLALLAHHADVNKKTNNHCNPVFLAALHGRKNAFIALLQHGADLASAKENALGASALYAAVMRKQHHMIPLLLERGADINERNIDGRTALFLAVRANDLDMAKYLLSKCANPNIPNVFGKTPLHIAASSGNMEMVKLLMHYHANPKPMYTNAAFPQDKAAARGHAAIVKLMDRYARSAHTNRLFGWYQHHQQAKASNTTLPDSRANAPGRD